MRFLLIPVADALPAVQAHMERWPGDDPPSPDELAELVALTVRASEALLRYAEGASGLLDPNHHRVRSN